MSTKAKIRYECQLYSGVLNERGIIWADSPWEACINFSAIHDKYEKFEDRRGFSVAVHCPDTGKSYHFAVICQSQRVYQIDEVACIKGS